MASIITADTGAVSGTAGLKQSADSSGVLALATGTGTTAVTIDASQNVGIGVTSMAQKLQVNGKAIIGSYASTGAYGLYLRSDASNVHYNWQISTQNTVSGAFEIARSDAVGSSTFNTPSVVIDSIGNLLVGTTSGTAKVAVKGNAAGALSLVFNSTSDVMIEVNGSNTINGVNGAPNAGGLMRIWKDSGNNRSISAAGTLNASGADYAEYMVKTDNFAVAKGDVIGINPDGKLTNVFDEAVTFVVKSTDPSYVGADTWGAGLEGEELEAARQTVDRIAFAGQVPVNVWGAVAGQYIIPVNDNGAIKGEAVSNPTFEQYQQAVGKVIAIEQDGRARIIVKVA